VEADKHIRLAAFGEPNHKAVVARQTSRSAALAATAGDRLNSTSLFATIASLKLPPPRAFGSRFLSEGAPVARYLGAGHEKARTASCSTGPSVED